ncbi:hypothetical protein EN45_026430 [Penicillium chrysogenum]|uniref:Uncharacterized protein n=1 Tax=Penicillium chrysogenum TaxID=5076 RepID=A0A167X737_PENCH|nr:hypothetical protein EN45_026430 [Penicillium chrysogenum]
MKALSHNYLIWLAVFSLHAPVINTNISPYFRWKEYSEATLGAWPHQAYRSSPAVVPLLNIQKDHPTCHDNKDHLLLMAPRGTEVSNPGPMILDTYGGLVWNEPVRYGKTWAVDVRFLDDEPYISLWASKDPASEVGHWPVGGPRHGWLRDNGIQEIDIATGEVLFQWTVTSYYKLEEGYYAFTPGWGEDSDHPFEPFVLNSAHADSGGNYLVSIRHMSSIAYIDCQAGDALWKF